MTGRHAKAPHPATCPGMLAEQLAGRAADAKGPTARRGSRRPPLLPLVARTAPRRPDTLDRGPRDVLQPLAGRTVPELAALDVADLPTVELAAARIWTRPLEATR